MLPSILSLLCRAAPRPFLLFPFIFSRYLFDFDVKNQIVLITAGSDGSLALAWTLRQVSCVPWGGGGCWPTSQGWLRNGCHEFCRTTSSTGAATISCSACAASFMCVKISRIHHIGSALMWLSEPCGPATSAPRLCSIAHASSALISSASLTLFRTLWFLALRS